MDFVAAYIFTITVLVLVIVLATWLIDDLHRNNPNPRHRQLHVLARVKAWMHAMKQRIPDWYPGIDLALELKLKSLDERAAEGKALVALFEEARN